MMVSSLAMAGPGRGALIERAAMVRFRTGAHIVEIAEGITEFVGRA
jgi:hypothetical protein